MRPLAASAERARLDPTRLSRAVDVVRAAAGHDPRESAYPGAVVAIAHRGDLIVHAAIGDARIEPDPPAMRLDAVFDLASLTKVLVTTTSVLLLLEQGAVSLDDRLDDLDPDLANTWLAELTPRLLLTHTSGVPWVAAFAPGAEWLERTIQAGSLFPAGADMHYSCTNFLLLQRIIERASGERLDDFFAHAIAEPLRLGDARFLPLDQPLPALIDDRLVPTEVRGDTDRGTQVMREMSARPGVRAAWLERHTADGRAAGVVHDENAAALGGVAGNAGLFGTALDVLSIGQMYVDRGLAVGGRRFVSAATIARATRPQTPPGVEPRGLGWQLPSPGGPFGDLAPARCYGHTGFTGTALWIDPDHHLVAVLLTNRLQFGRANERVLRVRRLFFNTLQAALSAA